MSPIAIAGLSGVVAFTVTAVCTPVVILIARRWGWVAHPAADRWHSTPTALMGGIAIFAGVAVAVAALAEISRFVPVVAAGILMFAAGAVDDRRGISPLAKVLVQVLAAGLLIGAGYRFELGNSAILSVGLTLFWVLGITNAINLVDNMDGLSAGVSAIAALSLAAMALLAGAGTLAVAALAVTGGAGGFLLYNFKPARIFMGDCGSLFLGFTLAALSVMVQMELGMRGITAVVMTALVLGVPILDTTLVTVVRTLNNRPVSQGGRDHSSHRLVRAGLNERQAVMLLYSLSGLFAILAPVFYLSDIRLRVSLTIFTMVGAVIFAAQIGALNVYEQAPVLDADGTVRRSWASVALNLPRQLLGPAWKPVMGVLADILIVTGAFVLAHALRFEDGLTPARETFLLRSLPVVIGGRVPVFLLFGFYRAIWRHAGALDMARVVAAVTVSTLVVYAGLVAMHGFDAVSRGVIVIDWMAVTLGILFSRFGFRGIRSYLSAISTHGRAVAVYGAGDDGADTLRLLRSNGHDLNPVVVVTNRRDLRGQYLQGIPVVGDLETFTALYREGKVTELILPEHAPPDEELAVIEETCRAEGIPVRTVTVSIGAEQKHS